jgi:hypothetical protein
VINHFPFFCDAISFYDNAPIELDFVFNNLIVSFKLSLKECWQDYFDNFPQNLKEKMLERFDLY